MTQTATPEFSRPMPVAEAWPAEPVRRLIEADEDERAALTRRLGLHALTRLVAEFTLRRVPGGPLVLVEGRLEADVVQTCVVTLEPVASHVEEMVCETFAPAGYEPPEDADPDDLPEILDDEVIDLGELAAQLLSLTLDPYPRAPEAGPEFRHEEDVSDAKRTTPFAGLAELLKKR